MRMRGVAWRVFLPPVSILLLVAVAYFRFTALGLIPVNSDWLVNTFEPWKSAFAEQAIPYSYNNDSDPVVYMYPIKFETVRQMREGEWPLWNPYILAGAPLLTNNFSTPLNPLNLVFFFLPFPQAWGVFLVLQLALAGLGTYWYMRELGVVTSGSLLGAYAYALNGTFVVWLENVGFVAVYAWVPLFLWISERIVRRKSMGSAVIGGYVLALYFFSGMIQVAVYALGFSLLYLIMRLVQAIRAGRMSLAPAGLLLAAVLMIASMASSPQVLLEAELIRHASRPTTLYAGGTFIHPPMLLSFVSPYFFGVESRGSEVGNAIFYRGHLRLNPPYVGVVTLILAVIGWFHTERPLRNFYGVFSAGLVLVFLLLAISPIAQLARCAIPLFESVDHYRIMALYTLSVSILSGFGLAALTGRGVVPRFRRQLLAGLGLAATTILAGLQLLAVLTPHTVLVVLRSMFSPVAGDHRLTGLARFVEYLHRLNAEHGSVLLSQQVVVPTALFLSGLAIVYLWTSLSTAGARVRWLSPLVLVLVAADLVGHALVYPAYGRTAFPETPAIRFLKEQQGLFRIWGLSDRRPTRWEPEGDMLPPNTSLLYGLHDIRGYETVHPRWYYTLITGNERGRILDKVNEVPKPWLNFLNVRFILTAAPLRDPDYRLVYDREIKIYENLTYGPRTYFIARAEFYDRDAKVLQRVRGAAFDPRSTVVLLRGEALLGQREEAASLQSAAAFPPRSEVRVLHYWGNGLEIAVLADRPGWLVLSESYFPGWGAWVNGVLTPVLRANYAFRAVAIPAGKSLVIFRYRPNFGLFATLASGVIPLLAWALCVLTWNRGIVQMNRRSARAGVVFHRTPSSD